MKKEITTRDKTVISFIFTYFVSIPFLNYIIGELFHVGGMVPNLVVLGIIMLCCYKTTLKVRFTAVCVIMLIYGCLLYIFTRNTSVTTLFGREFIFYFIAAGVLAMYECDTEKFLRYAAYASLIILPFYTDIFVEMNSTKNNTSIGMSISYSMTPLLVASIMHFCFYRRRKGVLIKIIYVIDAFLVIQLMLKGNRGAVIMFIVALAYVYINRFSGGIKNRTSILRIVIVFVAALFVGTYFYEVLGYISDLLESVNMKAYFIEKILGLQDKGDVTNGRRAIFEFTLEEFGKSPIWGHGLSTLYYNSGGRFIYPHNFVFQLVHDGGLLLAVPVLITVGRAIWYSFSGEDNQERIFAIYLVIVCLPRNMFSADIWESQMFWFLIFHSLRHHRFRKKIPDFDPIK